MQRFILRHIDLIGEIPSSIGNIKLVSLVEMSYSNNLVGPLPDALYSLKNLYHFNVYDNRLDGTISPSIGYLEKLEFLALDGVSFLPFIPFIQL